ncbi:helix-turn-helix transcriptional regulator [Microbacterium sp. JZ31]|uniref:helix-turn-helix transcriptional regulator n=1 Tax=Microbacterium sp. JZ31 TaxID=1906274 RepID=UPI0019332C1E|nr:WYL domain-containing protein [Microbacterium sp. JZ31]
MARTSRLLLLLSLLQARRDWPGGELAARLGIAPRTLRRDIERLREMGYRIEAAMGPYGGYRLAAGSELPPLLFDDDQAVAIGLALRTAAGSGADIAEASSRALTTVRQVMPDRLRRRVDGIGFTPVPDSTVEPAAPVRPETLALLTEAVRRRQIVRLDEDHANEEHARRPPRRVQPHALVTWRSRWYLLAWDERSDDWRVFRADRMRPRSSLGPGFTRRRVPGDDPAAFVSARFRGSDSGDAWPCIGTVTLALAARDVAPFAGDGTVLDLGDGRCRLRSGSWSWAALAAALGRFDAPIADVEPRELAEAFAVQAARFAEAAAGPS